MLSFRYELADHWELRVAVIAAVATSFTRRLVYVFAVCVFVCDSIKETSSLEFPLSLVGGPVVSVLMLSNACYTIVYII